MTFKRFPGRTRRQSGNLAVRVRELLQAQADTVPFHSWTHTEFVCNKAIEFARDRGANERLVAAAALVHDLNYLAEANSAPDAGRTMRKRLLRECGFAADEMARIEQIIHDAHTEWRSRHVDAETACLSDADTLYKALPITPVLFSHRYLDENKIGLAELAAKIINEQSHKLQDDYYFYDASLAERYRSWVEANLRLWEAIRDSLGDPDVQRLVERERPSDPNALTQPVDTSLAEAALAP
jgi:uncharacterized protein